MLQSLNGKLLVPRCILTSGDVSQFCPSKEKQLRLPARLKKNNVSILYVNRKSIRYLHFTFPAISPTLRTVLHCDRQIQPVLFCLQRSVSSLGLRARRVSTTETKSKNKHFQLV